MKMRLIVSAIIAAVFLEGVAATDKSELSPAEKRAAVLEKLKARRQRNPSGGLVAKEVKGPSLLIVNTQNRIPQKVFEKLALDLATYANLPWKATSTEPADGQTVARASLDKGAAGVVAIIDTPDAPAIVIAPEEGWSAVNVAKLAEGNPTPEVFQSRVQKEVWRAAAWAVGGGNSSFQPCLLRGVSTMKQLDAIPLLQPGPEPNNKMIDEAHRRGVQSVRFASYRQACREGWAPAPTNDVQKTIWDQVHATPKNPITIEYDPKKGR